MHEAINTYADWQWNVHPWSKQDSPAAAIDHFLAYRLADAADSAGRAFAWLCYGQRHAPDAVAAYRESLGALGLEGLLTAVLKAHGDRKPDHGEAAVHLEWQAHSSPHSLISAARAWRDGEERAVEVMFSVLAGQRHNGRACQLYRACFADDLPGFMEIVQAQATRFATTGHDHPYLEGAGPDARVLRDEVPNRPPSTGSRA